MVGQDLAPSMVGMEEEGLGVLQKGVEQVRSP